MAGRGRSLNCELMAIGESASGFGGPSPEVEVLSTPARTTALVTVNIGFVNLIFCLHS